MCDLTEFCTGSSATCGPDAFAPDASSCEDGDACSDCDMCMTGICEAGALLDCDDDNACTADSCDEISGCANEPIPACATPVPSGSLGSRVILGLVMLVLAAAFLRQRRHVRV